jgi:glycine betaine/proline transport system permease protein
MSAQATLDRVPVPIPAARLRALALPVAVLTAVVLAGIASGTEVPSWLDARVSPLADGIDSWIVSHRNEHWLFTGFFSPLADLLDTATAAVLWILQTLPWPAVLVLTALVGLRVGGAGAAASGAIALAACGILGFWDETMISLSLMILSVVVALLIGVPLGIWTGLSDRAETRLRAFLDAAQVMPAFVYLLPIVVVLGIGNPSAIAATVIFAVPPAVRLTSHGIRSVPLVANEVGRSFGCTPNQLLWKVQLPMARRSILLGLNQVIMMAFGIVVIAALVGTGGLGAEVLAGMQKNNVGRAFAAGLAIVLTAIALDRISTGDRSRRRAGRRAPGWVAWIGWRRGWAAGLALAAVGAVAVVTKLAGVEEFLVTVSVAPLVNDAVVWVFENLRTGVPIVGGTGPFSDFVVINLLTPIRDLLWAMPWLLVVGIAMAIGWASRGWRLAALCGASMLGIGALRVWDLAMDTLSQVLVAVAISIALAIPIGIWAGRSDRVERFLRPLLDAAQVMPPFVYLVPVLLLFNVGRVPGVIASVVYALPPAIRLTNLGLRQVPFAPREAAISFGATPVQEMTKVQLPLALRSIMLGINQTVLMVLSMVVIAGLIGGGALGLETVYGLTKSETGRGVAGGLAIVLLAIVLDRISQAWGTRRD